MGSQSVTIREATAEDPGLILGFIKALAQYEKLAHEVVATEESLRETLFGTQPVARVIIGEINGIPSGFALYFHNYSTFLGRPGIYLEDLFVNQACRGKGLGKALIVHLASMAYKGGFGRLDWAVLDWNKSSIEFYHSLGAKPQSEWTGYRLDRAALGVLAGK